MAAWERKSGRAPITRSHWLVPWMCSNVVDRYQGEAHCVRGAVSVSVLGCRHRQLSQLGRGDLEGVGQGHDLRPAIQDA